MKNQFSVGDSLMLMSPSGNQSFVLTALRDKQNNAILLAPGACYQLKVKLPRHSDLRFAMLLKQVGVTQQAGSDLAINVADRATS